MAKKLRRPVFDIEVWKKDGRPGMHKMKAFYAPFLSKNDFRKDVAVVNKPTASMVKQASKRGIFIFCFIQIPEDMNPDVWIDGFLKGCGAPRDPHLCFFNCVGITIKQGIEIICRRWDAGSISMLNLGVAPTNSGVNIIIPDDLLPNMKAKNARTTEQVRSHG